MFVITNDLKFTCHSLIYKLAGGHAAPPETSLNAGRRFEITFITSLFR